MQQSICFVNDGKNDDLISETKEFLALVYLCSFACNFAEHECVSVHVHHKSMVSIHLFGIRFQV